MNFWKRHFLAVLVFIAAVALTYGAIVKTLLVLTPGWSPVVTPWSTRSVNYLIPLGFLLLVSRFLPRGERRPNIIVSASALMAVLLGAILVHLGFKEFQHSMRTVVGLYGIPVMLAMVTAGILSPPFRIERAGVARRIL
jgi:hypothetical protein